MLGGRISWRTVVPLLALTALVVAYATRPESVPIDAGSLTLVAPQVDVEGRVALPPRDAQFRARVVDEADAPIADAMVCLTIGDELRCERSAADGSVDFAGLPRGSGEVVVVATRRDPLRELLPEVSTPEPRLLVLGPELQPLRFAARERSTVQVQLQGPAAAELAGHEVVLLPKQAPYELDAPLVVRALADAQGAVRFDEVRVGAYTLEVRPPWAVGSNWPDLVATAPAAGLAVEVPFSATPVTIAATVSAQRIAVRVLDAAKRPVSGAMIVWRWTAEERRIAPAVTTDAEGRARSASLPLGRWTIIARAGAQQAQSELLLEATTSGEVELTLAPSENKAQSESPDNKSPEKSTEKSPEDQPR